MIIVDFERKHAEAAAELAMAGYEDERRKVPSLPEVTELPDLTLPIYLRSQRAALCLQPCLCLSEEAPAQRPEASRPQLLSFYSLWLLHRQEKTIML